MCASAGTGAHERSCSSERAPESFPIRRRPVLSPGADPSQMARVTNARRVIDRTSAAKEATNTGALSHPPPQEGPATALPPAPPPATPPPPTQAGGQGMVTSATKMPNERIMRAMDMANAPPVRRCRVGGPLLGDFRSVHHARATIESPPPAARAHVANAAKMASAPGYCGVLRASPRKNAKPATYTRSPMRRVLRSTMSTATRRCLRFNLWRAHFRCLHHRPGHGQRREWWTWRIPLLRVARKCAATLGWHASLPICRFPE